ncbi:DoxX family protein [Pontimicrobium sp. SW4]|uniref:DoxX family protein n=1 Tax=Pontimicrobium sp. SW4 TaxID=3153519 RepID=A0AAU7BVP2_9FLAO
MQHKALKIFLRLAIALSFLSAVADRFGYWAKDISVWGNWDSFLGYTELINPWVPSSMISFVAIFATGAEVLFALALLLGFKTELFAKLSGYLMLIFALAITFSTGIKGAFDYSVFTASAGAFALSTMKEKYLELDLLFSKSKS